MGTFCDSEVVTFIASDPCDNAPVRTTATFTIDDRIIPTISPSAQSITVECDGTGNTDDYDNWIVSRGGAMASDFCASVLTWTASANADSPGPVGRGAKTVTFIVQDTCGNSAQTTATYTVQDTAAPSITTPAQDQTVECDSSSVVDQVRAWVNDNGGARATDVCSTPTWSNTFTTLTPNDCGSSAVVTFRARDSCGNTTPTTATFRQQDTVAPVITNPASDVELECSPNGNDAAIQAYINSLGGATAQDACSSTVTWTNNFVSAPQVCQPAVPVQFTVTDRCGLSSVTTGSIAIVDETGPTFTNFPADVTIPCDQSTEPANTGFPSFNDNCDANVEITFTDSVEVLPFTRQCPGDTVITRTFIMTDHCNNVVTRDQTIVYSIPEGPCTPVPCNPVPCTQTSCSSVPCLPVSCGSGNPPIYFDDDDGTIIAPSPIPGPVQCEPTYIYVFDDDEGLVYSNSIQYPGYTNDSSLLYINFFALMLLVLFLL